MSHVWRLVGFGSLLALLVTVGSDDVWAKNKKAAPVVESFAATPAQIHQWELNIET